MVKIFLKHLLTETAIDILFQHVSRNFKPLPKFYVGQYIKLLRCTYKISSGKLYHTVKNATIIAVNDNQLTIKLNSNSVCSTSRIILIYNAKIQKYEKQLIPLTNIEYSNESYDCAIDSITEVIVYKKKIPL